MRWPEEIQFERESGCLIVRFIGRGLVELKEATIKAVSDELKARPAKAVLADLRKVAGPFTFMDRYQMGELTGSLLAGVPIAVLAAEQQLDRQRIGRLVATNRGATLEIFTDPVAAWDWFRRAAGKG